MGLGTGHMRTMCSAVPPALLTLARVLSLTPIDTCALHLHLQVHLKGEPNHTSEQPTKTGMQTAGGADLGLARMLHRHGPCFPSVVVPAASLTARVYTPSVAVWQWWGRGKTPGMRAWCASMHMPWPQLLAGEFPVAPPC